MPHDILYELATVLGSAGAAWAAVRIEIKWIIKTLDRHEQMFNTVERRKQRNA